MRDGERLKVGFTLLALLIALGVYVIWPYLGDINEAAAGEIDLFSYTEPTDVCTGYAGGNVYRRFGTSMPYPHVMEVWCAENVPGQHGDRLVVYRQARGHAVKTEVVSDHFDRAHWNTEVNVHGLGSVCRDGEEYVGVHVEETGTAGYGQASTLFVEDGRVFCLDTNGNLMVKRFTVDGVDSEPFAIGERFRVAGKNFKLFEDYR